MFCSAAARACARLGQVPLVVPFVHSIVPDASMLVSEKRPPPPPEPISFKQGERFSARSLATPPNNREAIPRTGRQYRQVKVRMRGVFDLELVLQCGFFVLFFITVGLALSEWKGIQLIRRR